MSTHTSHYQYPQGPTPPSGPPEKKGMAVTAMVLGIIAIVLSFIPVLGLISFLLGPLAVIFGIIALVQKRGKGQAIAGIITGAVGLIIVLIGISLFGAAILSLDEEMQRQDELEEQIEQDAEDAGEEDVEIEELEEEADTSDEDADEEPTGEWVEVETLSGTGDQRGEVFTIENDARISYEFDADDEDFAMGVVYLMQKGDTLDDDGGIPEVMIDGSETGETMVYQTGEVYLDVAATGYGSWTVTVEEQQ